MAIGRGILRVVNDSSAVDPLGEALHFLRMSGVLYSSCELSEPWGIALPRLPGTMMFYAVLAGRCWLEVEGVDQVLLQPGDLTLVPHGQEHSLRSDREAEAVNLFDLPLERVSESYEMIKYGGGGAVTRLFGCVVRFDHPAAQELVRLLPRMIRIEASSAPELEWMQTTWRLMAAEAQELKPGGETVITRLADILVIQAIRSWIAEDAAAQTGWLGALQDPQIGRVITLIHRDPGRTWTVASLAAEVAMSRSAFAARFTELVGEPAMHYVARWRMHVALTLLKDDDAPLADLANRLGYQSEAAFSRAFKRFIGVSPGAARRNRDGTDATVAVRDLPI